MCRLQNDGAEMEAQATDGLEALKIDECKALPTMPFTGQAGAIRAWSSPFQRLQLVCQRRHSKSIDALSALIVQACMDLRAEHCRLSCLHQK